MAHIDMLVNGLFALYLLYFGWSVLEDRFVDWRNHQGHTR